MHNLFAMEAISIAEAHGVPTLALSPCLVPQVAPASLQRRFQRRHPALCAALARPGAPLRFPESGAAADDSCRVGTPRGLLRTLHVGVLTACPQQCEHGMTSEMSVKVSIGLAEEEDLGSVRWADVEHWLWPLFSQASCAWRQVGHHTHQHPSSN